MEEKPSKSPTWLLECRSNVYSQTGEDGIIAKILEILPKNDKWCVEFGATDGIRDSNTRNLIINKGYSAVLIESKKQRFAQLKRNYAPNMNVVTVNQSVGWREEDNLDHILKMTSVPRDFDFLSIDIDGNDYHVWKAVSQYKPKVICIEFNPTCPTEVRFIQPADPRLNQGSSLLSLVELGKQLGYELLSVLHGNAFFVRREYYPLFEIGDNSPTVLRTHVADITYLCVGYDGRIFLHGNNRLPCHYGIKLKESKVQHLPRILRKYPDRYRRIEWVLFAIYLLFTDPHMLIRNVSRKRIVHIIKGFS